MKLKFFRSYLFYGIFKLGHYISCIGKPLHKISLRIEAKDQRNYFLRTCVFALYRIEWRITNIGDFLVSYAAKRMFSKS